MSKETKDKMPDEWERAYAEAYPDRVPPYVQKAVSGVAETIEPDRPQRGPDGRYVKRGA